MAHFYIEPENINNSYFIISGGQKHYIAGVRRFKKDDEIMLFDGLGNSYKGQVLEISKNEIKGKVLSSLYRTSLFDITLWTAVPKGDRFEYLIEKSAEIGAAKIVPLIKSRSAIKKISDNKIERFKKISIAASSQCGRSDIMLIEKPIGFIEAVKKVLKENESFNILPWESEDENYIMEILPQAAGKKVNIFIGPEGGFENNEIECAKKAGFKTVSLGENILRIETAALTSLILTLSALNNGKKA